MESSRRCRIRRGRKAENAEVILVLERAPVCAHLGLPYVHHSIAYLTSVATGRRGTERETVIEIETAVMSDDEEWFVSGKNGTCPVERLDVERACLRTCGSGSDLGHDVKYGHDASERSA
jgi:hypothetical protein